MLQPPAVSSPIVREGIARRPWALVCLTLLAVGWFLVEFGPAREQIDDAFISFRYARNLVDGYGLVFNVGERVEGYTNPLWTLLIAAGIALGGDAPQVGHALSLISGSLLLVATAAFAALLLPRSGRWLGGLAPLLLLASNSFACWVGSGLETPLFALFVTSSLISLARGRPGATAVWCGLATLTRPEGALLAATLLGADWIERSIRERSSGERSPWAIAGPVIGFALFIAALTLARYAYYGDPLPNTFYAKAGGIPLRRGLDDVLRFAVDGHGFLVFPAALAAVGIRRFRIAALYVAVTAVYCVAVGGDNFAHGRFLLPVLPALIGGAVAGAYWALRRSRPLGVAAGLCLPVAVGWSLYGPTIGPEFYALERAPFPASARRAEARDHELFGGVEAALWTVRSIESLSPPPTLVASVGIGALGYYGRRLAILDLVGLVDEHIARSDRRPPGPLLTLPGHQRTDSDYVLSRKPDLILIPQKGSVGGLLPIQLDFWDADRMEQRYRWDARRRALIPREGTPAALLPAIADLWSNPGLDARYAWDRRLQAYRRVPEP